MTSLTVDDMDIGDRHCGRNAVMMCCRKDNATDCLEAHLRTSVERGTIDRPLGMGSDARALVAEPPLTTIQTKFEAPKPTELLAAFSH